MLLSPVYVDEISPALLLENKRLFGFKYKSELLAFFSAVFFVLFHFLNSGVMLIIL